MKKITEGIDTKMIFRSVICAAMIFGTVVSVADTVYAAPTIDFPSSDQRFSILISPVRKIDSAVNSTVKNISVPKVEKTPSSHSGFFGFLGSTVKHIFTTIAHTATNVVHSISSSIKTFTQNIGPTVQKIKDYIGNHIILPLIAANINLGYDIIELPGTIVDYTVNANVLKCFEPTGSNATQCTEHNEDRAIDNQIRAEDLFFPLTHPLADVVNIPGRILDYIGTHFLGQHSVYFLYDTNNHIDSPPDPADPHPKQIIYPYPTTSSSNVYPNTLYPPELPYPDNLVAMTQPKVDLLN